MDNDKQQAVAAEPAEQEISIVELFGMIWRRKIWIFLFLALALALAITYLVIANPTYEASASAMIQPISNASSIESLLGSGSSSAKIDTEIQLITSSTNLQNALDLLDLDNYTTPDGQKYSELEDFNGLSIKESKMVTVESVSNTTLITITVKNGNAQFCADFANAILEAYTELLTRISKSSKSAQREFIEEQIPVTEKLLEEANIALSDYKEESGITQMTERIQLLTSKIALFQLSIEPLKLQLLEANNLVNALNPDGTLLSLQSIQSDPKIQSLVADYTANIKELLMYQSMNNANDKSRVGILQNAATSNEKNLLNFVTSLVGQGGSSYAKAITDSLCVQASIDATDSVIALFDEEMAEYPLMERKLMEYTSDVEIYQSLLLSLRQLLEETKMLEAAVVGNVNLIDSAIVPEDPVSPRKLMTLAVAVIGGIVLGAMLGLFLEFMDDSIKDEDTVKAILGRDTPSLGWVPCIKDISKVKVNLPGLFVLNDPDASVSERFKGISNNIVYSTPNKIQVLSINSTDMSEGKTTTICNVAASFALTGKKVLIIDGDFRKPAIEAFFNLKRSKVGFVDAIIKGTPIAQCIIRSTDKIPNLHIMPVGMGTRNPNALYNSEKMHSFFDKLRRVYDYIFIDCPPLSYASEFTNLAKHIDGYVLCIRAGISSKRALSDIASNMHFISAPLLGFVFYGVVAKHQSSYSSYGYGHRYGYGKYGYGSKDKGLYTEEKASYKKIYKREVKKRDKVTYGKLEPVLAFANGAENAFRGTTAQTVKPLKNVKPVSTVSSTNSAADSEKPASSTTNPVNPNPVTPVAPTDNPSVDTTSAVQPTQASTQSAQTSEQELEQRTSDMLAEIESIYSDK